MSDGLDQYRAHVANVHGNGGWVPSVYDAHILAADVEALCGEVTHLRASRDAALADAAAWKAAAHAHAAAHHDTRFASDKPAHPSTMIGRGNG